MTSSSPYDSNQKMLHFLILLSKKPALERDICCLNVHTLTRRVGSYYPSHEYEFSYPLGQNVWQNQYCVFPAHDKEVNNNGSSGQ